jgi:hypothetical protein
MIKAALVRSTEHPDWPRSFWRGLHAGAPGLGQQENCPAPYQRAGLGVPGYRDIPLAGLGV